MAFLQRFRKRAVAEPPEPHIEPPVAELAPEAPGEPTAAMNQEPPVTVTAEMPVAELQQPEPPEAEHAPPVPPEQPGAITISRTLVKSEPEVLELIASDAEMRAQGVDVTLTEKGFGTRVAITAGPGSGFGEAEVQGMMDRLAEPQRRAFTNT